MSDRVDGAPDLVIEVLSPRPRIGDSEKRLGWFAEHGVRECWLVHRVEKWIEVIQFRNRAIARRDRFDARTPISSGVLPEFRANFRDIAGA